MKLLIIDDKNEYLKAAIDTLRTDNEIVTATTYEEALKKLEGVEGVITDLFFPSSIDWMKFVKSLTPLPQCDKRYLEFLSKTQECIKENPSGIGIALLCKNKGIPFVILSEGDRHSGSLGAVRHALIATGFITGGWDPLFYLLANHGDGINKREGKSWLYALRDITKY
jgi:CheY-like chemotaxis protein